MKLRDYQDAAVESIFEYFETKDGNPVLGLPTGTGKSPIIGGFIFKVFQKYPNQRVLKLTHVKELIEQNFDKLLRIWPTAPAGIYSAGLGRREASYPITYAGVASVAANLQLFGHIDLIIIDECHLVSTKDDSMYQTIIYHLKKINPYVKVIGLTATMFRLGTGMLTDEGGLFTDICFDLTKLEFFNWFIEEGYLVNLIPRKTTTELDIENVTIHAGEFVQKELQAAVDRDDITRAVLTESQSLAYNREHWLVFASGIDHVEHVCTMLNEEFGIHSTYVHSKLGVKKRDQNIADFKAGKYRAMVNNGILTTGFDYPAIDCEVMMRPTNSPGLWVQMLGRGTRCDYAEGYDLETKEGRLASIKASRKRDCLVLDFANNTYRLGPINDPVIPKRRIKGGGGAAPIKICEACQTYNHASVRFCVYCGAEFPKEIKFGTGASTAELVRKGSVSQSAEPIVQDFKVEHYTYNIHRRNGRPDSIKISYSCGLRRFDEWMCLEHIGYAASRARNMWQMRTLRKTEQIPLTTQEAMLRINELIVPKKIRVWMNKPGSPHPEIISHEY